MRVSNHMQALAQHLTGPFLQELRGREALLLEDLQHCRCIVEDSASDSAPAIEFDLPGLFDAVWRHATRSGIDFPAGSNWDTDFEQFCHLLMHPWPLKEMARHGYTVRATGEGQGKQTQRYRLTGYENP